MHHVFGNGSNFPAVGLGTWTLRGEEATRLVAGAIQVGYRHIDTATSYENEGAVGEGLRASDLPRDQVFLTTKVWPTDIAGGDLQRSVVSSLKQLGVDYVDLALIHWPSKTMPLAESIKALNEVWEVAETTRVITWNSVSAAKPDLTNPTVQIFYRVDGGAWNSIVTSISNSNGTNAHLSPARSSISAH